MTEPPSPAMPSRDDGAARERAWFVPLDGFDLAQQRPRHAWPARLARAAIVVGMLVLVAWVIVSARTQPGVAWSAWVGGSALLAVPVILFIVALLLPSVHRARMRAPWARLSTPEGVEALIATKRLGSEDALRERRCAVLRACAPLVGTSRWHEVDRVARSFGLAPPAAIVVGRRNGFAALRAATIPVEMLEPEEIGRGADAADARSMLRDKGVWLAVFLAAPVVIVLTQTRAGLGGVSPLVLAGALALVGAWRLLRAPTGGLPGAQPSLIGAPGLALSRGPGPDRAFSRDDSVLVIQRHPRRAYGVLATITRRDAERVSLGFPTERDPRLLLLWRLWLHPRASRWDPTQGVIVPADEPGSEKELEIPG